MIETNDMTVTFGDSGYTTKAMNVDMTGLRRMNSSMDNASKAFMYLTTGTITATGSMEFYMISPKTGRRFKNRVMKKKFKKMLNRLNKGCSHSFPVKPACSQAYHND